MSTSPVISNAFKRGTYGSVEPKDPPKPGDDLWVVDFRHGFDSTSDLLAGWKPEFQDQTAEHLTGKVEHNTKWDRLFGTNTNDGALSMGFGGAFFGGIIAALPCIVPAALSGLGSMVQTAVNVAGVPNGMQVAVPGSWVLWVGIPLFAVGAAVGGIWAGVSAYREIKDRDGKCFRQSELGTLQQNGNTLMLREWGGASTRPLGTIAQPGTKNAASP